MTTEELADRLAAHRTIGQAPRRELEWIAAHGTLSRREAREVVSTHSEVVQGLYILLTGRMSIFVDRGAGKRKVMEWQAGDVSGLLPYSRTMKPPGDTIVDESTDIVTIPRSELPALISNCPEVTAILVHVMTDRARRFTSTDLRDEKTISLGKLAAGLAHELNNPASAAVRDAKSLAAALTAAEDAARALGGSGITSPQMRQLDDLRASSMNSMTPQTYNALALSDREDAIGEWLRRNSIEPALAEDLAGTPISMEALQGLAGSLKGPTLEAGLRWIAASYAARALVLNIERATSRIHTMVAAVKGFTHMDRAPEVEKVNVPLGLAETATLLEGEAKAKSVVLNLNVPSDLPPIRGISAEINQIWMNLVDNAIDAAPSHGHVDVTASREGDAVVVRVVDDGSGIPPEIRERIFDPFFTTKAVGEGTGLGLDIVRRIIQWHNGDVDVDSSPGRTEFRVRLPVAEGT
ncbi:MAG TPA: ATP-binding protein [Bacteroidota bacterium]|nr:ATP-binding protein [Bacteroidota bacterium]